MSCLFAVRLSSVAEVTILGTWSEAIASARERGILFENCHESSTVPIQAELLGTKLEPCDLAIILVKSWQTEKIAGYLPQYLSSRAMAVSLQNGFGNLELLGSRVFPGSTAEGATLLGPAHVRAGGAGPTHMVAPEWVIDLFRGAGFDCYRCDPDEADSLVWGKLTVSCGINALTALLRIANGELLKRPDATGLMIKAATECAAVAQARGIRLPFLDPASRVREVAEKTAANQSSMLQDLLRGAPTECDAINGAVVCEGRLLGIPTPVNEILWQLIRAAVYQNRSGSR
jgi:2-dehydropantoate 2-reductase